ncbi:sugar transferase [Actinosynnema sp. NPDC050436]|uniref:sugar transferase n=1 Tax=Actinosynnema sp. NPDC050436 TaxID=3155659 RepID=UPI0033F118F8
MVAAVGVPAGCVALLPVLRERPLLTLALLVLYEVAVVAVGFGAAVLDGLRVRWSARVAETFDGAVQRTVSRYTRHYLRYVAAGTRYVDLKGVATRAEYTLEMKDVYVRLSLDRDPARPSGANPIQPRRHDAALPGSDIWQWLRTRSIGSVVAVIGAPGRGKTTLLRHVAYVTATGGRAARRLRAPRKIPILVHLRDRKEWTLSAPRDLVELITRSLPPIGGRPVPPRWVERNLKRGRFLLLLDGLDEIADPATRRAVAAWIETQSSAQVGNLLVLTSRPHGYRDNAITGATVLAVQAFGPDQIEAFIKQWYLATSIRSHGADNRSARLAAARGAVELSGRLEGTPALHDLASNPLLLTMISTVHHYRDALPGSRSELYREICDVFLGKRHEAVGVALDMPAAGKKMVLQELAYAMMRRGVGTLATTEAVHVIGTALTRVTTRVTPTDFLRQVEDSSGLLMERERDLLAFAHLTVQEFLAAEHIRERGLGHELVEVVAQDWWHETVLLYAANADATSVVDACLHTEGPRRADLLALAVRCVEEGRELSPEVRAVVEQRLNPADLRSNAASRHNAARARLLLRTAHEQRVQRGVYSSPPVTWLEYQYFLDTSPQCRTPDHWVEDVFAEGTANEPATGIRHEDAVAFCTWLTSELGGEHRYRLPTVDELDAILPDETSPTSFWALDSFAGRGDRRAARLFGALGTRQHVPYPLASPEQPAHCDGGHLVKLAADAAAIANEFNRITVPDDPAASLAARLAHCGGELAEAARIVFARESPSSRSTPKRLESRQRLHTALRRMREGTSSLSEVLGQVKGDPSRLRRRLDPKRAEDRRLIGFLTASVLLGYLRTVGQHLVVHDRRVSGRMAPIESLRFVRADEEELVGTARYRHLLREAGTIRRTPWSRIKPVADRIGAAVLLTVLAPVLLALAIAVVVDTRGPLFYIHRRCGRYGVEFSLVKFRTMVVNADLLTRDLAAANEGSGLLFKMRRDPRVTPVGRFLRRYNLDELPQLINVLAGHMSMVGPRPPLPVEAARYDLTTARKLLIKPGLTGLWQISGRSDLSWEEATVLELDYLDHMSFAQDLAIAAGTIRAAFVGQGAY